MKFWFINPLPLEHRFELIAQGSLKPQSQDFVLNPEGRSLIHYACLLDNISILKQCLANGQSAKTVDFWKELPLKYAFQGQSLNVLNFFLEEYNFDLKELRDNYGQPLWWEGFRSKIYSNHQNKYLKNFEEQSFKNYIGFLKKIKVDFNQRQSQSFGSNLAYKLLSSYSHWPLYVLLENNLIDVNQISRTDHCETLSYWAGFMEDNRFAAFLKSNDQYIQKTYELIYKQCNPNIKNKRGDDVLTHLCKQGYLTQVKLFLKAHPQDMSTEQQAYIKYYSSSNKKEFLPENIDSSISELVFYKVQEVENGLFYRDSYPLVKGLHDREINQEKCLSAKSLITMKKVVIPNGTELYKSI